MSPDFFVTYVPDRSSNFLKSWRASACRLCVELVGLSGLNCHIGVRRLLLKPNASDQTRTTTPNTHYDQFSRTWQDFDGSVVQTGLAPVNTSDNNLLVCEIGHSRNVLYDRHLV